MHKDYAQRDLRKYEQLFKFLCFFFGYLINFSFSISWVTSSSSGFHDINLWLYIINLNLIILWPFMYKLVTLYNKIKFHPYFVASLFICDCIINLGHIRILCQVGGAVVA